ncbi:cysteine proteinases superfamily protein isoform X4 [Zea mays]|uniref:cysteine proteinases superfamily protein isoform X4 n=1 Tax=Zea mays TaxID=4577 RepID=UPI0016528018|nr:cysteine proteinases superfamily protein isoform X4 [Zea mays]
MPRCRRDKGQALIDLDSDAEDECQSKGSQTSRTTTLKTSGRLKNVLTTTLKTSGRRSKNVLPSFYDNLPQGRASRHATSRRNKTNQDKLNTDIFELYMEYVVLFVFTFPVSWSSEEIYMYQIFTFFNGSGHWSLLVLCHFGDANCSDIKKGPRMMVLDSLNTTDPTRLRSAIRKFIIDIYKTEEREESKQFINKICLEFPKVPQQNGDECGIYVLYFIRCFLLNKKLTEVLENKKLEEKFTQLFDDGWFNPEELENFRKDIHSFQANRNNKVAE